MTTICDAPDPSIVERSPGPAQNSETCPSNDEDDEKQKHEVKQDQMRETKCEHLSEGQVSSPEEFAVEDLFHCVDHACPLFAKCTANISNAVLDTAVSMFREVLDECDAPHPLHLDALWWLAHALYVRYGHTGQILDIQESINLFLEILQPYRDSKGIPLAGSTRDENVDTDSLMDSENKNGSVDALIQTNHIVALDAILVTHPMQTQALINLASTFNNHYPQSYEIYDTYGAISSLQHALSYCSLGDSAQSSILRQLPSIILARYFCQANEASAKDRVNSVNSDVPSHGPIEDSGIAEAVKNRPERRETHRKWMSAIYLRAHCNDIGGKPNLDISLTLHREVISEIHQSNDGYPSALNSLADALMNMFGQRGQQVDLEEAISLNRNALVLSAPTYPSRPSSLSSLAESLITRFGKTCEAQDLNEAIQLNREALALCVSPGRHWRRALAVCANTLCGQFGKTGLLMDLDDAIVLSRKALALCARSHPRRFKYLNNLAHHLRSRFRWTDHSEDLEEIILLNKEMLALCGPDNAKRPAILRALAQCFTTKFVQTLQPEDFSEALQMNEEALALHTRPRPDQRPSDIIPSTSTMEQFPEGSQLQDQFDQTVLLFQDALCVSPSIHRPELLFYLALAHRRRFDHRHQDRDLEEAIRLNKDALTFYASSHPKRCFIINGLVSSLTNRYEQKGQQADLDEVISLNREVLDLRPSPHPDRVFSLNNLAAVLIDRYQRTRQQEDLDEAILLLKDSLPDVAPDDSHRSATRLFNLARALWMQSERTGHREDLEDAIALHREALDLRDSSHPTWFKSLGELSISLMARFKHRGQQEDLDEAVTLSKQSLDLCPPDHPLKAVILNNLAAVLMEKFDQTGQRAYLDDSIRFTRGALSLPAAPTEPDHQLHCLNNLAMAHVARFNQSGQLEDLEIAISLNKRSLGLCTTDHFLKPTILNNLSLAIGTRFEQSGEPEDLDEHVRLNTEALSLRDTHNPDRPLSLINLANAHSTRFDQSGQQEDLDKAILLSEESLDLCPLDHSLRPAILGTLSNVLSKRFNRTGHQRDFDEHSRLHGKALSLLTAHHTDRPLSLNNVANAHIARFERSGQRDELDKAIKLCKQSLDFCVPGHPLRSTILGTLAYAFSTRFNEIGQLGDLHESIRLRRESLSLCAAPNPDRPLRLSNLALALVARSGVIRGRREDLDEAIASYEESLELCASTCPTRPTFLSNLAQALSARSEETGQLEDLDKSICLNREVLLLRSAPSPSQPLSLNNLAAALVKRFKYRGNQEDLDEAIRLYREGILVPLAHSYRSAFLDNLAIALSARFTQGGQMVDLGEAILLSRESLDLSRSSPHPKRLIFLARYLLTRFCQLGRQEDLDESIMLRREALCILPSGASARLRTAKDWARDADRYQHITAIEAYDEVLQSLSQLSSFSLDIQSRQKELVLAGSDGIARDAARYAILHNRLDKAVEYLEEGRAVFWSQILHLRSPFDGLRHITPELADRLVEIAAELEHGSHRNMSVELLDNQSRIALEQEATRLRGLSGEWSKGLGEVRQIKGFENFLRPRRLTALQLAAAEFPLVILVSNAESSDCLVMTSTAIHHIPLPDLSELELRRLVNLIRFASSHSTVSRSIIEDATLPSDVAEALRDWTLLRDSEDRATRPVDILGRSTEVIFEDVLNILWCKLAKPVIDFLGLKRSESPAKLRWCPTGLFAFLPIHAAGCYSPLDEIEYASQYMVSSYTPTIGMLLPQSSHNDTSLSSEPLEMMVIVDAKLSCAIAELNKVRERVPKDCLVEFGTPNAPARVDSVILGLSTASVVHFACHGTQDRLNPLNSGLQLRDGRLKISNVMQQPLPNGSLAFLCACETGMGDEAVPDEAMSIGASLLFSGYRSVVATMWKIMDADGPTIADAFYEELFRGPDREPAGLPNANGSAQALHVAVEALRKTGVEFRRWVPFIHLGK